MASRTRHITLAGAFHVQTVANGDLHDRVACRCLNLPLLGAVRGDEYDMRRRPAHVTLGGAGVRGIALEDQAPSLHTPVDFILCRATAQTDTDSRHGLVQLHAHGVQDVTG